MTALGCLFAACALALAACGEVSALPDAGEGPPDAAPCDDETDCPEPASVCHSERDVCVECEEQGDCEVGVCNAEVGACEGCTATAECTSPEASLCDEGENACVPCVENAHCDHVEADSICELGACNACELSAVALAGSHTCGLRNNGTLWCWGNNALGQLGVGTVGDDQSPTTEPARTNDEGADWHALDAAGTREENRGHTCGIRDDGSLWCWGRSSSGELGLGDDVNVIDAPQRVGDEVDWVDVATGSGSSCALRDDGALYCWGDNADGQLALGPDAGDEVASPTQVDVIPNWQHVRLGDAHGCGIREDGSLWCWGRNDAGQLGVGEGVDQALRPREVVSDASWKSVALGAAHTCGIQDDDTMWCWGDNSDGRLGLGDGDDNESGDEDEDGLDTSTPVQVDEDAAWRAIALGDAHTCGIRDNDSLWCWGRSTNGQAGTDDRDAVETPEPIEEDVSWSALALGGDQSCARRTDGALACWGLNDFGQLGNGEVSEAAQPEPTDVPCPIADE